jgi:ribosomal protein S18 acetylase RimI-like enzyme
MEFKIRPLQAENRDAVQTLLDERWGDCQIVTRGKLYDASILPGFVAIADDKLLGLITYRLDGDECEIISLDSLKEKQGIGTALLNAVRDAAREASIKRVRLITTNDNLTAIRFYQKYGFRLIAVHVNAIAESRKLKPQIPETGIDGIPIHDEIELELLI